MNSLLGGSYISVNVKALRPVTHLRICITVHVIKLEKIIIINHFMRFSTFRYDEDFVVIVSAKSILREINLG